MAHLFSWLNRRGRRTETSGAVAPLTTRGLTNGTTQERSPAGRGGVRGAVTGDDVRQTIIQMRERINLLNMREQLLRGRVEEAQEAARQEVRRNNRDGAVMCLRRRTRLEAQIRTTMAARERIEEQILAIETARNNQETYEALRMGNGVLQRMNQGLTLEQVDRTMLDMQEHTGRVDEITMALQQPITTDIVDEGEIERQMVELQFEVDEDRLLHEIPIQGAQLAAAQAPGRSRAAVAQNGRMERAAVEVRSEAGTLTRRTDRIAARLPEPPQSIQSADMGTRATSLGATAASCSLVDTTVDRELEELAAIAEPRI